MYWPIFRQILTDLDELPSHVIANLYEGFVKQEAEMHAAYEQQIEKFITRFTGRLEDAIDSLKNVKFGGLDTPEQRNTWVVTTVQTIE